MKTSMKKGRFHMAKKINYKGIIFDDYSRDNDGHYWAEICQKCFEKYKGILACELDDGNVACGICSIQGCLNSGASDNVSQYYVDFADDLITWED